MSKKQAKTGLIAFLAGAAAGAAALFLSKKENREKTKQVLEDGVEKAKEVKDEIVEGSKEAKEKVEKKVKEVTDEVRKKAAK